MSSTLESIRKLAAVNGLSYTAEQKVKYSYLDDPDCDDPRSSVTFPEDSEGNVDLECGTFTVNLGRALGYNPRSYTFQEALLINALGFEGEVTMKLASTFQTGEERKNFTGIVLCGDEDDPVSVAYKDGKKIAAWYASFRGAFQVGAFIEATGETLGCCNFRDVCEWVPVPQDYICVEVAKEVFDAQ